MRIPTECHPNTICLYIYIYIYTMQNNEKQLCIYIFTPEKIFFARRLAKTIRRDSLEIRLDGRCLDERRLDDETVTTAQRGIAQLVAGNILWSNRQHCATKILTWYQHNTIRSILASNPKRLILV